MSKSLKFLASNVAVGLLVGLSGCASQQADLGSEHSPSLAKSSGAEVREVTTSADIVPLAVAPAPVTPTAEVGAPVEVKRETPQFVSTRSDEHSINASIETPAVQTTEAVNAPAVPADLKLILEQWQRLPDSARLDILTIIKDANK